MDEMGPNTIHDNKVGYYPDDQATPVLRIQQKAMMATVQVASKAPVE